MAEALAPEVVPFSSEEIGIKNLVFRTEVAVRGHADLMPKSPGSLTPEKNSFWRQKSTDKEVVFQPTPERVEQNPSTRR